jgi:purine nucleoside phosphorylase
VRFVVAGGANQPPRNTTVVKIGIIGGSGFYALDRLENVEELNIETPFGATSAPIVHGKFVRRALWLSFGV